MFIQEKGHETSINIEHNVLYKEINLKTKLKENLIKLYTKTHQIGHFFPNFLAGEHAP